MISCTWTRCQAPWRGRFGFFFECCNYSASEFWRGTTDQGSGYALDRELEIYNQSGIPAPEVLRMATFTAAQVMKRDSELGSIAPGKLADMILVHGDPTSNISDIRKVDTVIKGGNVIYTKELDSALGVRAQSLQNVRSAFRS